MIFGLRKLKVLHEDKNNLIDSFLAIKNAKINKINSKVTKLVCQMGEYSLNKPLYVYR